MTWDRLYSEWVALRSENARLVKVHFDAVSYVVTLRAELAELRAARRADAALALGAIDELVEADETAGPRGPRGPL